jgi:CRP/FNR family transcriptional regulator, anaerobic regulatory protein
MLLDVNEEQGRPALTASGRDHSRAPQRASGSIHTFQTPLLINGAEARLFERIVSGKRRIERKFPLFREGEQARQLYVVRAGQFKAVRTEPSGTVRVIKFHMPGDVIGVDTIFTGEQYCTLLALEDSEVCEIPYTEVLGLIGEDRKFAEEFIRVMSRSLAEQNDHSTLLSLPTLDGRFAAFLLAMSAKYAALGYSNRSFRMHMSRSDISSYIGASPETVSRVITKFNALQLTSIHRREVQLHDRESLVAMMSRDAA